MNRNNNVFTWSFNNERRKVSKFYKISKSIKDEFESVLKKLCVNKLVLEYGCGAGSYINFLSFNKANTVVGIDIDEVALCEAKKYLKDNSNIYLLRMDAENMAFKNETFDLICGVAILHHLDLNKSLSEIRRVLKNGGYALFIEPLGENYILNIFRKLTPKLREKKEHPLKRKDLELIKKYFSCVNFKFYYLLSLISLIFLRNEILFSLFLKIFEKFDKLIFALFPFTKLMAWQVLIICKK